MIPVFMRPEWTGLLVAGSPEQHFQKGYVSNHAFGAPVTKIIDDHDIALAASAGAEERMGAFVH
jgi:hypothetical protein